MIVMIMSDKFAFGAPPLIACVLLVLTGCATMSEAFAGFVDKNVIMIAGFMVVMAALEKTSLIDKVKATMFNMASKGGYRNYILLLIVVMLGASVMSGTGYYVLVLSLVSTIPYNKNLPISKIFMPLGYATYNPIVPVNMAFYVGLVASLLESSGVTGTAVPLLVYSGIKLVSSIAFLVWAVIGYRFLPDHPIAEAGAQASEQKSEGEKLSRWKEIVVYIAFVVNFVAMIFLDKLGEPGYAIPGVIAAVLFVLGILNFKEVRNNIASPLILMMAGVIGVAGALANSGFTAMVGDAVAGRFGYQCQPICHRIGVHTAHQPERYVHGRQLRFPVRICAHRHLRLRQHGVGSYGCGCGLCHRRLDQLDHAHRRYACYDSWHGQIQAG